MKALNRFLEKTFQFLASLKLAVIIIISLATLSAIGTFVEAKYDAQYAQKLVYHSPYMYFVMALLCINLFNVMVDRLPWKSHHTGFVMAHIGIIVLILGSLITKIYGIDGSLSIDEGQSNRYVMLNDTEFSVWASFGENGYKPMGKLDRDFLVYPPEKDKPSLMLGQEELKVTDYYHYANRSESIVASETPNELPAVRINLQNANVNMTDWLMAVSAEQESVLPLGPANVVLTKVEPTYKDANEVYLKSNPKSADVLDYYVFTKSKGGLTKKGSVKAGESIDLGWMGLQLRVLNYFPHAVKDVKFTDNEIPNARTQPAVKFQFRGQDHWLSLNSTVRLFSDQSVYIVAFNNKRLDLGFDVQLEKFNIGRYQGTMRAASYSSDVVIPGEFRYHISMNDPLKYKGFTLYQASFQEDESGQATTSILSVNKDPGRWIKYLGSLLIVLGSVVMFYFKRYRMAIFGKRGSENA